MPHRTKVKYCSWGNVSYDVKLDIVLACYSHNEHLWFKLLNHFGTSLKFPLLSKHVSCPVSTVTFSLRNKTPAPSTQQHEDYHTVSPNPNQAEPPATFPASLLCNAAPGLGYAQVASQSSSSVAGLSSLQSFQL